MIDYKKIYYYIICLVAIFVLLWAAIDFGSAAVSFIIDEGPPRIEAENNQHLEEFYNQKMTRERMIDSLARLFVSGCVFVYCRRKITQMEAK